nr:glutamic acid-rich protein-like isoform X2 [Procambarus clarkii]
MPANRRRFSPNSSGGNYRSRFEGSQGGRGNVGGWGNYDRGNRRYDHSEGYGGGYGDRNAGGYNHQVVNPWETGMAPSSGFMPHAGGTGGSLLGEFRGNSDIVGSINHLSRMNNPESKIALNILSAVLAKDGGYDIHRGQSFSPSMHHLAHKVPQRDHQYSPHRAGNFQSNRRARGGRSFGQAGRQATTQQQPRKTVYAKKGKPNNNKGLAKDQKKKGEASSAAGQTGDKTEGSSATADPNQSGDDNEEMETEKESSGEKEKAVKAESSDSEEEMDEDDDEMTTLQALRCHICNFYKFTNMKTFRNHLESKNHERMQRTYHLKGTAILQYLRAQSKLAAQRNILRLRRMGSQERIMQCTKCQCHYMGTLAEHSRTREHSLVSNFTKCSLCSLWFENRMELEKHRLSFLHMMREAIMEKTREKNALESAKEPEEEKIPEYEPFNKFHVAVEKMKNENKHGYVFNLSRMPLYDPASLTGLNFIMKKSHLYCKICSNRSIPSPKEALDHFSSLQHYEKYAAYLKEQEEAKEKAAREEEEEKLRQLKAEEEAEAAAMENKNGDNVNTEDENDAEGDAGDTEEGDADAEAEDAGEEPEGDELEGEAEAEEAEAEEAEVETEEAEAEVEVEVEAEAEAEAEAESEAMDTSSPAGKSESRRGKATNKVGDTLELLEEDDDAILDSDVDDEVKESLTKGKAMDVGDELPVLETAGVELKSRTKAKASKAQPEEEEKSEEKEDTAQAVSTPRGRRGRGRARGRGARK